MKTILISVRIALILCFISCTPIAYFNNFVGTWVPLDSNAYPMITKLQIIKRNNFYLLAAKHADFTDRTFFYVCTKDKRHLTFTPSQYYADEYGENEYDILTKPSDLYFDKKLNYLYFLNAIYIPADKEIFGIYDNHIIITEP